MFDYDSNNLLSLVIFLLPGFLAAWIFYGLTSHPKPSQFERTVQALIFTFIIQVFVVPLHWFFEVAGTIIAFRQWDSASEGFASMVLAVLLGTTLAYFTNNDSLHKYLRDKGFTTRTSHPSEWFYVFSKKITFIILHLKDGRRLYGWPKEWPTEPEKGQFYMMLPSWILCDGKQLDLPELDGILVNAKDVQWVEFLNEEGEIDE